MRQKTQDGRMRDLALSSMLLAIGLILPFFTGQIPQIGSMLLPMHLPVFLCGMICGWQYGGIVGLILPLLRYAAFGMPPAATAGAMAFELAAYGSIAGFLYRRFRCQNVAAIYCSLLAAMLSGRIVWGVASMLILGAAGEAFTMQMFLAGALFRAVPGILLQLVVVPGLMVALREQA